MRSQQKCAHFKHKHPTSRSPPITFACTDRAWQSCYSKTSYVLSGIPVVWEYKWHRQEFRHRKAHISTSVILCKFTLALLVWCYVKGAITTDTNLNRSSSENTLLQDSQVSTISTFWINMLLKILQVGSPCLSKEMTF